MKTKRELKAEARGAFEKVEGPAWEAYQKIERPAWEAYQKAAKSALEVYFKRIDKKSILRNKCQKCIECERCGKRICMLCEGALPETDCECSEER